MKILFVNKYYHPSGGPEKVILQYQEKLESLGDKVILFSMQHPKNLATPYSRYFVCNVDYNGSSSFIDKTRMALNMFYSLEAKKKMELLLVEEKPDLAHLHNIYHQISPSILPVLKKKNIPVVMTLHDFKLLCPNYTFLRNGDPCESCEGKHFYKAVIHKCVKDSYWKSLVCSLEMYFHRFLKIYQDCVDAFIVLSEFSRDRFIKYGVPEEKIFYLPNYISVSGYSPRLLSQDYILFFGRLEHKNGIETLIKAMKHLPEVRLKVAGEGEMRRYLDAYVKQEKLENISFLNFVTSEKLNQLIANSFFTVFPNHAYHLCPMSILESFAFGKPVIGSNLGSVPELIEDGINGLLFEPKNVEELAEKIKYLYHHPLLAEKMGMAAREKVEEKYSEEEYYKKLLGLYDSLIKNGVTKNV
ncbi:MAG: glycosyltransferase family 4 protein [candidate division Zixibacteria bacterium]|nr:glycosyltransferase family 4 protein [candidate division Zixibacteria bacterium]